MSEPTDGPSPAQVRRLDAPEAIALLPELVALAVRSKAAWGYDAAFMAAFATSMKTTVATRPGRVVLLAEDEEQVVGFAIVDDAGDRAWLEDLWVEPGRFGQGVGRLLWAATVDAARSMSRQTLELEADPNAEGFYLRMGARTVGQRASTIREGRLLPLMRASVGPAAPQTPTRHAET